MYLASYFKNSGKDGVYLAASHDGFRFEELVSPNIPVLVPQIGIERLTRDPFILRGPNGMWHMTWTTGWWERGIGYARSRD